MKKTSIFLTSALVVMAILAGCSDTVAITGLPQNVKSGTINQIGDFLAGQAFDPKKFTVDITYDNGQVITDDGSVTVQLDGDGTTVAKGSTVSANIGQNVDGFDVIATGSVAVYDINRIEVAGPASYAKSAVIPATDLTVTAYYYDSEKTEKTMPLATSEFEIVAGSTVYANGKGTTPSIPETGATITIRTTLAGNVVQGLFSYTETYADTTADLPYEIESIEGISYTGQLLALNYDEVPVPALEDVAVTVNGDDGDTHDITAADLEGATAQFVDSESHLPLVLTDLVGNTEEYAVELTWGDVVKYSPATYVTAKEVKLNVEAKPSFALTEGNELGTANADNFTIYYTVGEGTIATVLPSSAVTVAYVDADQSDDVLPADTEIGTDAIYVKASYMGEEAWTSLTPGAVTVVPVSVKDIVLTDAAKAAIPAAQYYNATGWTAIEIDDTAIESYTVVFSDGSEVSSTDIENPLTGNITDGVAYYLDNAGKEPLADVEPVASTDAAYNADYADTDDASYYDALADADQIFVQVAYTEGTDPDDVTAYGYLGVDLQTAYASSMLAAAEYEFDEPMYGSDITTVVQNLIHVCQETTASIRQAFEQYDPRKTGFVSVDEAKQVFSKFEGQLTKHAIVTLTRAFDRDDGTYEYDLLLKYMRA